MTLEGFLTLTRQRIVALVLVLVVCVTASLGAAWVSPSTYTASGVAYLRVNVSADVQEGTDSFFAATQMAFRKIDAVIPVFTSEAVGQRIVDSLGLDATAAEVAHALSASHAADTVTVKVSATASSADDARLIADEAIRQAALEIKDLEGENSPVEIILMSPSQLLGTKRSPVVWRYVAIGILAGLVIGYSWIFFRELSDKTLRGVEDARTVLGVPVLGLVPASKSVVDGASGKTAEPSVEEHLRMLRTNVRYAGGRRSHSVLVVTSAGPGEGRSTVAANLARVLALSGEQVVLVEGDLRDPGLAEAFDIEGRRPGLVQVLEGKATIDEAVVETPVSGLDLVVAGATPPNPSELLGSARMPEVLAQLARTYIVIIDSPPVLSFTDGVVLGEYASGVLLVARERRTTADDVGDAVLAIEQGGGRLEGVIVNRASSSRGDRRPLGVIGGRPVVTSLAARPSLAGRA